MPTPREIYGEFNVAHCDADEPWGTAAALMRLREVARREGLEVGDSVLLGDGSNETWRVGDRVVRICWRGDLDRLDREAALADHLPWQVPPVDTVVVTECLAYSVAPVWPGVPLGDLWADLDAGQRHRWSAVVADLADALHATTLPPHVRARLEAARPDDGSSAVEILSRTAVPGTPAQLDTVVEYLHGLRFREHDLVERARSAAVEAWAPPAADAPVLLHGDLQPGNVLVTDHGVVPVDLEFATYGPAEYDLANGTVWRHLYADPGSGPEVFTDTLSARQGATVNTRFVLLAFLLRGAAVWAPTAPLDRLPPGHPFQHLRRLLAYG